MNYTFFDIIEIFNKFEYHWIQKFTSNPDLRKQDFLSEEKKNSRKQSKVGNGPMDFDPAGNNRPT